MLTLFKKAGAIFASRILTRASQLVAFVVLARVLSPSGFGAYGVLTSAIFLAGQIGNLGLRQASAYKIGQKEITDGAAMGVMLAFWPFATIATAVALLLLNHEALNALGGGMSLQVALVLALAGVLFTVLIQGVFLGRGEIKAFSLADAGPRVLQSVLAVILWSVGALTVASALWSFAAGFLLVIPLVAWLAMKGAQPLRFALGEAPKMVAYGLLFAVSMFLITLQGRVGVFFLSSAEGHAVAGQFFAAQRATEIFLEIATAVGLVLFSEAARAKSFEDNMAAALKTATTLALMFLVVGAGVALAAPLVVKIILGGAYDAAAPMMRVLALGLAPAAFIKIMNGVVAGSGRPFLSASVVALGLIANLGLAALLIPRMGPVGMAWAMTLSQVVAALAYAFIAVRFYNARIGLSFSGRLLVVRKKN